MLLCWTGDNMAALEPATGKVLWKYPTPPTRMIINVPTPVVDKDRIFLACFYDGSYLLQMKHNPPAVEKIWRRQGESEKNTDALHSMISTPILKDGYIYGVDSYGEFRCLEADTGDRLWEDHSLVRVTGGRTSTWCRTVTRSGCSTSVGNSSLPGCHPKA